MLPESAEASAQKKALCERMMSDMSKYWNEMVASTLMHRHTSLILEKMKNDPRMVEQRSIEAHFDKQQSLSLSEVGRLTQRSLFLFRQVLKDSVLKVMAETTGSIPGKRKRP